jgi:hypothetical protein
MTARAMSLARPGVMPSTPMRCHAISFAAGRSQATGSPLKSIRGVSEGR